MRIIRLPTLLTAALLALLLASTAAGSDGLKSHTYHFGTHPARTSISFVSDAELETIHGTTNKMTGSLTLDATGKRASGILRIGVRTLDTGIELRNEHLQGESWLDAARHPWITLKIDSATEDEDGTSWSYEGKLTIKGVTKSVKGSAQVVAFPSSTKGLGDGEWVRVRSKFDVKLSDHGVVIPKQVGAKVNDTWNMTIDLFGTTAKPARRSS